MTRPFHIAIGGFQHETNTFAPHVAPYEEFVKTDSWPGLTQGEDLYKVMSGLNLPIAGFIETAQTSPYQLLPMLWCSAEPCSYVTSDAFEKISGMFCDFIKSTNTLDAIYLDLHGAMVVENFEDGEGELLRRIRNIVGPDLPIIISLDLHGNITEAMVRHTTAITIYRTYPHLDMAETGARAYKLLELALQGKKIVGGMRKVPFLIPLTSQWTDMEPCKSIYQEIISAGKNSSTFLSADFATGFPPSDIYECGAAVVAYGVEKEEQESILDQLFSTIIDSESLFDNPLLSADEATLIAIQNSEAKPIVIADAQDNPGAGGTGDTTAILASLVTHKAQRAFVGVLYDPEVALIAHGAGIHQIIEVALGGKSNIHNVAPYRSQFLVESLGDGNFTLTGDMYKNSPASLGPMALLKVVDESADVHIVVSSHRAQCVDLSMFRHLGVEPTQQRILVVKSSVQFRADFDPIAAATLVVAAPGVHPCELEKVDYKNLRPNTRQGPMGIIKQHKGPWE